MNEKKSKFKEFFNSLLNRKESTVDTVKEKEYQDKIKVLETQVQTFAEEEEKKKDAQETARLAKVDQDVKEFKERLTKEKYPVAKLDGEGFFAIAKQVLLANELQFGEGKKLPAIEILNNLAKNITPEQTGQFGGGVADTSTDFQEVSRILNLQGMTKSDGGGSLPFDEEGMKKILCAHRYTKQNANDIRFKDMNEQQRLAFAYKLVESGQIPYQSQ